MTDFTRPPISGLSLTIDRRTLLRMSAVLTGTTAIATSGLPLFAQTVTEAAMASYAQAGIDWKRQSGTTIVLAGLQHPWMDAITPLIPSFTELTGIEVDVQTQSESEYVASLPVRLGAGSAEPDVYMVWALGQAITAGWLEPLGPMFANPEIFDAGWWDEGDLFESTREYQRWADGSQYVLSVTAEAQTLFVNQTMLDAAGLPVPTTMQDLLDASVALNNDEHAGIALRAKSGEGATWPAGGFIFSYGGTIIDADGSVALDRPEAVAAIDMYGRLLREAGPVGSQQLSLDGMPQ